MTAPTPDPTLDPASDPATRYQRLEAIAANVQRIAPSLGGWPVAIGVAMQAAVSLHREWGTIADLFHGDGQQGTPEATG